MSAEENVKRLERLFDTFEEEGVGGAAKVVQELFDPDIEFEALQTGDADA